MSKYRGKAERSKIRDILSQSSLILYLSLGMMTACS